MPQSFFFQLLSSSAINTTNPVKMFANTNVPNEKNFALVIKIAKPGIKKLKSKSLERFAFSRRKRVPLLWRTHTIQVACENLYQKEIHKDVNKFSQSFYPSSSSSSRKRKHFSGLQWKSEKRCFWNLWLVHRYEMPLYCLGLSIFAFGKTKQSALGCN